MKSSALECRQVIADAAERYMRQRSVSEEINRRVHPAEAPETTIQRTLGPYIAISREAGAGGYEIGQIIGEKLGWEVLGRDILDEMSKRYHLPRNLLEFVDEKSANWWHEMLGTLLDQKIVTQEAFVWHLGKIILMAATKGKVVFVGRGALHFLPRDRGVSVRIVAPEKLRIQRLMKIKGMSRAEAHEYARSIEKHRHDFIQRYFHHNVADAHLYDLVINTEHLGLEGAAEMVLDLYHRCPCSKVTDDLD